jgi:hypothetical protein
VSRTALAPTQLPIQWVPEALSLRVKRPGREADHLPPSGAEVKNEWSYTSTPQYAFMAWCPVKKKAQEQLYSSLVQAVFETFKDTFWPLVKWPVRAKFSLYFNCAPRHEGVLREWRYSSTHSWPRRLCSKSLIHFPLPRSFQGIRLNPISCIVFRNMLDIYGELIAPCWIPKLEDNPFLAVCDCLFNIFAAIFYIWRTSPPSVSWEVTMP